MLARLVLGLFIALAITPTLAQGACVRENGIVVCGACPSCVLTKPRYAMPPPLLPAPSYGAITPPPIVTPSGPGVAVSPMGNPMGVVVPNGGMGVVVSPEGQPVGIVPPGY